MTFMQFEKQSETSDGQKKRARAQTHTDEKLKDSIWAKSYWIVWKPFGPVALHSRKHKRMFRSSSITSKWDVFRNTGIGAHPRIKQSIFSSARPSMWWFSKNPPSKRDVLHNHPSNIIIEWKAKVTVNYIIYAVFIAFTIDTFQDGNDQAKCKIEADRDAMMEHHCKFVIW